MLKNNLTTSHVGYDVRKEKIMKYQNMDNVELLKAFETLCFRITNYPSNKSISKQFDRCEKEMCKRLGISQDELENV